MYLVFHVLTKAADDEEPEQDSVDWGASYDRSGRTYADAEIEDAWQKTESSASRARREAQPTENTQTDSADDEVSEVIREGRAAMRRIRHANDLIPDPELSAQIDSIENSCGQILSILEQRLSCSLSFAPSCAIICRPRFACSKRAPSWKKAQTPPRPAKFARAFRRPSAKSIRLSVSRSKRWMNTASSIWKARWTSCATCSNPTA